MIRLAPKTLALVPSGLQAPPKATPPPNSELNRIYSWIRSSGKLNFDNRWLSAIVIVLATLCAESSAVTSFAGLVKRVLTPIARDRHFLRRSEKGRNRLPALTRPGTKKAPEGSGA
jgi:hypothetical protein